MKGLLPTPSSGSITFNASIPPITYYSGSFTFSPDPVIETFHIRNNKKLKIGSYYEILPHTVCPKTKQAVYDHKKQKYVIDKKTKGIQPNVNSYLFLISKTKIKNKIAYVFADNKGFLFLYYRSKRNGIIETSLLIKELELNLWQI